MPVCDGPSCPGCGLPNYAGLCPHCRGDLDAYERELAPQFPSYRDEEAGECDDDRSESDGETRTYRLVRFSDLMASETMVTMVTQLRNEADKVERCPGYEYHHTASLLRYAAAKISLLTRELEEARRERSAAKAEVLTAQASLRRVERVLEEARALLRELIGSEPVLDDERLRYVEIQVDREAWEAARRAFAPPQEPTL